KETPATVRRWRGRLAERSLNRTRGAAFRQRKRKANSPFCRPSEGGRRGPLPMPSATLCISPAPFHRNGKGRVPRAKIPAAGNGGSERTAALDVPHRTRG